MAPKSQRSRACAQCRDRRVKCDETPEICNQCRRLGLHCSGPLVGSIVIDMTDRIVKPRGRKKKEAARASATSREKAADPSDSTPTLAPIKTNAGPHSTPVDMLVPSPILPADKRYSVEVERAVTAIRYHYRPPTFYQPSKIQTEALDNVFLAHYVQMNAGSRTYSPEIQWLNHLPRLHAENQKPAVRLALRAVSMAYYAKMHNDPAILVDSWQWYTIGLNAQRRSIAGLKGDDIPTEGEVLVPLILALYEVYVGTTDTGAMMHLAAAGRIMVMRGPDNCKTGVIWPLFKGIRNAEGQKCVIFGESSVFASPEWMTIPFIGMPKDAHQHLADIRLKTPLAMQKLGIKGNLRTFFQTPIPENLDVEPCREMVLQLRKDLNEWAATYPHLTQVVTDKVDLKKRSGRGLDVANESPQANHAPDTFLTLIASNYEATKLILAGLMYKIATQSSTPPATPGSLTAADYYVEATECADTILRGAAYMENNPSPGFDLLRSIGPVVSVICIGPGEEQSKQGIAMLMRWGSKITGVNTILMKHILGSGPSSASPSQQQMPIRKVS